MASQRACQAGKCNTSPHVIAVPPLPAALRRRRDRVRRDDARIGPDRAPTVTVADYERAEKFMNYNTDAAGLERTGARRLAAGRSILVSQPRRDRQRVLPGRCGEGHQGAGVQSRRRGRGADHRHGQAGQRGAAAVHADHVRRRQPVVLVRQRPQAMDLRRAGQAVRVGRSARAACRTASCRPTASYAAFIRDYNLWVRDIATGADKQLTTDGVKDFGYATDNAGWISSDRPVLMWSPDSKKIATFQQDQRKAGEMYLVNTDRGPSDAAGVEVSAAGRRVHHHDRARRHRRRRAEGHSAARCRPGPASLDALRRRQVRRRLGRRAVEPGRQPGRVRLDVAQPPAGEPARRRRRHRRDPRGARRKGRDVPRVRQRPRQLAATCPDRTKRSGFRRRTTGASSICTICRPAS